MSSRIRGRMANERENRRLSVLRRAGAAQGLPGAAGPAGLGRLPRLRAVHRLEDLPDGAVRKWNRRTRATSPLFDREDVYPDCTVQVLTNTVTGETSVGWWVNKREAET